MGARTGWAMVAAALSACALGGGAGEDAAQRESSFEAEVTTRYALRYLVSLPPGYEGSTERAPVLLFLHGSGERGDDLEKVKAWGPPRLVEEDAGWRARMPFIVISPQCPEGERWDAGALLALLDHVESTYRVDPDRVYVTGLSMGGYGTWALADAAPERFAAVAPVCGGYPYLGLAAPRRILELPVWAFHGDADDVVPVSETVEVIEALRAAGAPEDRARMTIYEGVGHGSWIPAYADEALWAWMLAQRRGGR